MSKEIRNSIFNLSEGSSSGSSSWTPLVENVELLTIPNITSTIENSGAHPSVVYFKNGWNGWKYWMAFTPYPSDPQEIPSIVVSNDAITWVVPDGLTNPIYTNPNPSAYDPELVYDTVNNRLLLYDAGDTRSVSYDGITWSARVNMTFDGAATGFSPSVIIKPDGTFERWGGIYTGGGHAYSQMYLKHATSVDGIAWTNITTCVYPEPLSIWHTDIHLINGVYYMLAATTYGEDPAATELWWLTSTDGLTWVSPYDYPVIDYHNYGTNFYRSCFIPTSDPTKVTIFATEWDGVYADKWNISIFQNISLPYHTTRPDVSLSYVPTLPYIVGDNFHRTDNSTALGTSPSGHVWSYLTGNLGILNNKAYRSSAGIGIGVVQSNVYDNIIIEARFRTTPLPNMNYLTLVFRAVDYTHLFMLSVSPGANKSYGTAILQVKNGVGAGTALSTGTFLKDGDIFGVKIVGETFYLMRNNVIFAEYTDSTYGFHGTKHGIWIYNQTAGTDSTCDLFTIRNN